MALFPVYNSKGEAGAFLKYPYLFNILGEWIGFVTAERDVYSVLGYYVGYLTNDPRILRKRTGSPLKPRRAPPPSPGRVYPPATIPLAALMSEMTQSTVDVLLDEPERLHTLDAGELRQDLA